MLFLNIMTLKETKIFLLIFFSLLLMNAVTLKADDSPGLPCGDPDVNCPIDGYVVLLIILVLFLSVKKMTDKKSLLKQVIKDV